ncbi:hypothetical protein ACMGE5_00435 [Macrococcus equi]|uniref:hypothetical protein n=1 Tax=Macrococcus equi TaxID=3395462 RepID=UPI0039BDF34F
MKKVMTLILAGSMLVGMTANHEAEAVNYPSYPLLSKSTVNNMKAGKLNIGGIQIGKPIGYYYGKKGYSLVKLANYEDQKEVYTIASNKYASGYAHFTSHQPINKRYITQITIQPTKKQNYSPSTIRKYYGKPITSFSGMRVFDGSVNLKVDYYKNIRFQYIRYTGKDTAKNKSKYKLHNVQITDSDTMKEINSWKRVDRRHGVFSGGPTILPKSEWK